MMTNLPACAVHDDALLERDLAKTAILTIGDSTAAAVLGHVCEAYSSKPRVFVEGVQHAPKYRHRCDNLDNHFCRLPGQIAFGSFSHYGATGPPYWAYAYPLVPWLAKTTLGMVAKDIPVFRHKTAGGEDPLLIVANSGFWDLSAWWMHEGNWSRQWAVPDRYAGDYVAAVERLVEALRARFPSSTVVWRLMHPGSKHSITPRIVRHFNNAVRSIAPRLGLPLFDTEQMVRQLNPKVAPRLGNEDPEARDLYGTTDGRHLHAFVDLAIFNVILNMARHVRGWQAGAGDRANSGLTEGDSRV